MRKWLASWLITLAHKLDDDTQLRSPGYGFRFVTGEGLVWVRNSSSENFDKSCPVYYWQHDYHKANPMIDWQKMKIRDDWTDDRLEPL